MRIRSIVRIALLAACLSPVSCLTGTGITTGNISGLYVPVTDDDDEQVILIAGTTASVPGLPDFIIDDPIVYGEPTQQGSRLVASKRYANSAGDELEFRRTFMPGTEQWLESVIIRHAGDEMIMVRLKGFHADERSTAWGIFY